MIIAPPNKYVVVDTDTKEVISEHLYTDEYTRKKAKEAAIESNSNWKVSKSSQVQHAEIR